MEAELVLPVGSTAGAGSRPPCVAEATPITVQTSPRTKATVLGSRFILSMVLGSSFAPSNRWVQLIGGAETVPSTKAEEVVSRIHRQNEDVHMRQSQTVNIHSGPRLLIYTDIDSAHYI